MSEEKKQVTVTVLLPEAGPGARGSGSLSRKVPGTVDGRGRNGWFRAREFEVQTYVTQPLVELAVRSRRHGGEPPVLIQMPPEVAQSLGAALLLAADGYAEKAPEGDGLHGACEALAALFHANGDGRTCARPVQAGEEAAAGDGTQVRNEG